MAAQPDVFLGPQTTALILGISEQEVLRLHASREWGHRIIQFSHGKPIFTRLHVAMLAEYLGVTPQWEWIEVNPIRPAGE